MSYGFQLLKLVINDNKINDKYLPITGVYDIMDITQKNGIFPLLYDVIDDLFLYIDLPKLKYGLYWTNDILSHIIKSITISIIPRSNYIHDLIHFNINSNHIKDFVNNKLSDYSKKLLYRDLDMKTRLKMSERGITLILPLKLNQKIYLLVSDVEMYIDINIHNLVENDANYCASDIKWKLKGLCGFLDNQTRADISQKANNALNIYKLT